MANSSFFIIISMKYVNCCRSRNEPGPNRPQTKPPFFCFSFSPKEPKRSILTWDKHFYLIRKSLSHIKVVIILPISVFYQKMPLKHKHLRLWQPPYITTSTNKIILKLAQHWYGCYIFLQLLPTSKVQFNIRFQLYQPLTSFKFLQNFSQKSSLKYYWFQNWWSKQNAYNTLGEFLDFWHLTDGVCQLSWDTCRLS